MVSVFIYLPQCAADLKYFSSPFKKKKGLQICKWGKNENLLPLSHVYTSYMVTKACVKEEIA